MAQAQVESANTRVEMEDDHEDMDEDTGEDRDVGDDEEGEEDSDEDIGYTRINLKDIKTAEKTPNLAVSVTVIHRDKIEMRNGKEQFMAEVADKTSAVDICVTNRNLFDKIKVKSSLFLENVSWSGYVIFLNEKSEATSIPKIEVDPSLVEEAFGRGEVVSIQIARALKPKLWVALKGKIVKQSVITKKYPYERKLLTHRQIKLADRSGSMYVDVWKDEAVNLESGDVIHMTGCKRKKSESVDESSVTTTRKTRLKKLQTTEFDNIYIARFARGTLDEIEVEIYESCPKQGCYHFKLDGNNSCESCGSVVVHPDCYATARVIVTTTKNKVRRLTVFWPQLCELYSLFDKEISLQSGKPTIEGLFQHLRGRTVKYQTCTSVAEFRL